MTELLEHAVERLRAFPPEIQDEFARILLRLSGDDETIYHLLPEEEDSLAKSFAQADRREFATDDDMRTIWAKHGL